MRYIMIFLATVLLAGKVLAQVEDSTQVVIPQPPPPIPHDHPVSGTNDAWLEQHNQALLAILNTLIANTFNGKEAIVLKAKFSRMKGTTQEIAERRTQAIGEFLKSLIADYNKRKK